MVWYPLFFRYSGNKMISAVTGLSFLRLLSSIIPYIPVVEGRKPVIMDAREGPHRGAWQCAFRKSTPRAASRSIFGVLALGCPSMQPSQSLRSSMQIMRTLGLDDIGDSPVQDTIRKQIIKNPAQRLK